MLDDKLVILILGVGGNVSQGILKALSISSLPKKVIGACISPYAFGLYTVDQAYLSPRADDPEFIEWLINTCNIERVNVILSGVEPVLTKLAENLSTIYEETDAICIVSSPDKLLIGNDKLLTCKWLEKNGFNFPRYANIQNRPAVETLLNKCGFPLIAKPRIGKGSQGLLEIQGEEDLYKISRKSGYLLQEHLGDKESEYTTGCFSDQKGNVRGAIAMRRKLQAGTTVQAEVGEYPEIRTEAIRIASALEPMGPCNIQMRMSNGTPVCFEINVRFSGTTPLRARFGFNEVDAAIRHFVLGESLEDLPVITEGIVLRYWNELYVDSKALTHLMNSNSLTDKNNNTSFIEDYGAKP